jgi:signal transduction histidine kinase/ligand-binding sensor domain-containing protein
VLAGLVLAITPSLKAANSGWFARPWQSDETGLPNNTIFGLAQTPDGYLWLGTPSGLARFDGINFEDFSPTNFLALPNRGALAMLVDRDGALWLALDRGAVVCLDHDSSRTFTDVLPMNIPGLLAQDGEGHIWVAYHGGAVYRLTGARASACTGVNGLPEGSDVCALASDNKGRLWFAKSGQFGLVRGVDFQVLGHFDPQPARLATARSGGVWLCAGLRLYKIESGGQIQDLGQYQPERPGAIANALLEDREGAVWIGDSVSGLFRHDESGFESIPTTHQDVRCLAEDREGNLWVGTFGGGLNRVRRRAISLEGPETGLPFPSLQSICQDASGAIWATSQNGVLVRRVGGEWTSVPTDQNWPGDATCVTADRQGSVWVGTQGHGLYCWREGHFVSWGDPQMLRDQTLHTLLASREGDLWIGQGDVLMGQESPPKLYRLRAGQLRVFEVPSDSRVIRAMAEDMDGNIWAGTSKGVLFRITGDQLAEVNLRRGSELASIRCLQATADGALWLGYAGYGLGRFKKGQYAEFHAEQGLADDYISHIVADDQGWLWLAADRGLFKVRQQDLDEAAVGHGRVRSIHYSRGEGLPSLQGNFGDSPDVLRSRDGRLWFPMRTALAVVDPAKLGEDAAPPPVLLTRITSDDRPVAWYGAVLPRITGGVVNLAAADPTLRLPPGHRQLEFEFATLSFTAPENIQFRYRLENYDDHWRDTAGTERLRSASYSRLPAGDYRFHVIACNNAGVWNQAGAVLNLIVEPFFWNTWWFRSLLLTGFTLSLIALVRYVSFRRLHRQLRVLEQQAALHKERARIAKDIHDDVGANLTQIALLGELAQQDRSEPVRAAQRLDTISATARQAIKSLDEIVWAVNPRNDTLAHLIDYAGQFALDYLRVADIRCRLDFPEQPPARELSTDLRHNLFLVIKEALNNIVKHAQATEVWLRAKTSDQALEMVVEDNGRGFERAPDDSRADGLRNMRQRLADIGGECRIESRPGAGTKVILCLPWPEG